MLPCMGTQNQTLKLTVDYDGKTLTSGLKTASGEVVSFGKKASNTTSKTKAGLTSISGQLDRTKKQIFSAGAAWASWETVRILKSVIDDQTNLRTAINRTIDSQDQFNGRQETLLDLANRTRSDMGETVKLFLKLREPMQSFGRDTNDTLQFIELFQKSLKKYPTTVQQAASSTQQLGQALGSNNFAGDEFKSLAENAQGFMEALRDGIEDVTGATNLSISDLKKMGAAGELTTDLVVRALATQKTKIDNIMTSAEKTIGDGLLRIKNNLATNLGNADSSIGIGSGIAQGLFAIADNLDVVGDAATVAFAILVARSSGAAAAFAVDRSKDITISRAHTTALIQNNLKVAQSDKLKTAARLKSAAVSQAAAAAEMRAAIQVQATGNYGVASVERYKAAKIRLAQTNAVLAASEVRAAMATNTLTAAQARATLVSRGMAGATKALSGAMALVGGPVGFAMLAGAGVYYWHQKQEELKTSIQLSSGVLTTHHGILSNAKSLSTEYVTATDSRKKAIQEESVELVKNAKAHLADTKARLNSLLAYARSSNPEYNRGPGLSEGNTTERALAPKIKVLTDELARSATTAKELEKDLNNLGKTTIITANGIKTITTEQAKNNKLVEKELAQLTMKNAKMRLNKIEYYKLTDAYKAADPARKAVLLSLFKSNLALEENSKKLKTSGAAATQAAKEKQAAADKLKQAINDEITSIKDKIAQLELTPEAYERVRLKAIGFKGDLLEEQVALWKTKEALKSKAEQLEENTRKQAELKKSYDDLRASNALQLSLLKVTGNEYLKVANDATKYSDAQKVILLNDAIKLRNANKLKEISDSAKSKNLELDYKINVQDGSLTEDQQRAATDKAAVSLAQAILRAEDYSAAVVNMKGVELTAIQVKERLADQQLRVADILRQSNAELLDHHQQKTLTNEKYQEWLLTQKGVDAATAEMIVKRKQTIELEKEFADLLDGTVKDALKNTFDTGNDALDTMLAKLAEAIILGQDLSGVFGGGGGGGLGGLIGSLFGGGFSVGGNAGGASTSLVGATYAGAYASGGSFTVGGKGGTDNNRVFMDVSRGERVSIQTPAQQRGGNSQSNVSFNPSINIYAPAGSKVEDATASQDSNGDIRIDLLEKQIEGNIAKNINNGDSPITPALAKKLRVG